MTTDRLEALRAVKADALALAAKAKALGLDATTVDSLAATVSAGLTDAAVKTRAPDSWRVTVRRWRAVPEDVAVEVIGEDELSAKLLARREIVAAGDQDAPGTWVKVDAIAAEPVWEPVAVPVEPEPEEPGEDEPVEEILPDAVEVLREARPVRIGPEPIAPAPKDDGIYEAAKLTR